MNYVKQLKATYSFKYKKPGCLLRILGYQAQDEAPTSRNYVGHIARVLDVPPLPEDQAINDRLRRKG